MKSIKKDCNQEVEYNYPLLMESTKTQTIVLMTDYGVGVVVNGGTNNNKVGFYFTKWNMSNFKPYCGKVTLINDDINDKWGEYETDVW